jgi:hypothetical protein
MHDPVSGYRPVSVLVVVVAVRRVPAPVVNVVDVIAMRNGYMATPIAVHMLVPRMHVVSARGLTFVIVIVVPPMQMAVVHIVDMIAVRHRHMSAAFAMNVGMISVFFVDCLGHRSRHRSTGLCPYRCSFTPTLRYERLV